MIEKSNHRAPGPIMETILKKDAYYGSKKKEKKYKERRKKGRNCVWTFCQEEKKCFVLINNMVRFNSVQWYISYDWTFYNLLIALHNLLIM